MKKKVFIVLAILLFAGAFSAGQCSVVKASPPGVWVCIATSQNTYYEDSNCHAMGRNLNRKKAELKSASNCEDKCLFTCKVKGCARVR